MRMRKKVGRPGRDWDLLLQCPRTVVTDDSTVGQYRSRACERGVRVRTADAADGGIAVWMRDRSAPRESVSAGTGTTEEVEQ